MMTYIAFVLFTLLGTIHIATLQEVFDTSNYRILFDAKGRNYTYHAERCKGVLYFSLSSDLTKVNVFLLIQFI